MNRKLYVTCTDSEKAFDRVDSKILVEDMKKRDLDWKDSRLKLISSQCIQTETNGFVEVGRDNTKFIFDTQGFS